MNEPIVTLSNGHRISYTISKVKRFCVTDSSFELYDLVTTKQDNTLTLLDIYIANNIGAGIESKHFKKIWRKKNRIEKALSKMSPEARLEEDVDDELWHNLKHLFDECRLKELSQARVTKILHKKRPRLIPIIDQEAVVNKYYQNPCDTTGDWVKVTKHIRNDLINNLDALKEIQHELKRSTLMLPVSRQQKTEVDVSLVRLFDMLLWEHYVG